MPKKQYKANYNGPVPAFPSEKGMLGISIEGNDNYVGFRFQAVVNRYKNSGFKQPWYVFLHDMGCAVNMAKLSGGDPLEQKYIDPAIERGNTYIAEHADTLSGVIYLRSSGMIANEDCKVMLNTITGKCKEIDSDLAKSYEKEAKEKAERKRDSLIDSLMKRKKKRNSDSSDSDSNSSSSSSSSQNNDDENLRAICEEEVDKTFDMEKEIKDTILYKQIEWVCTIYIACVRKIGHVVYAGGNSKTPDTLIKTIEYFKANPPLISNKQFTPDLKWHPMQVNRDNTARDNTADKLTRTQSKEETTQKVLQKLGAADDKNGIKKTVEIGYEKLVENGYEKLSTGFLTPAFDVLYNNVSRRVNNKKTNPDENTDKVIKATIADVEYVDVLYRWTKKQIATADASHSHSVSTATTPKSASQQPVSHEGDTSDNLPSTPSHL